MLERRDSDSSSIESNHLFNEKEFMSHFNICGFDNNIFVLLCLFVATSSFTLAQFFGAIAANSLAMYGDCATMALDSVTYLLNIYCERNKINGSKEALKLEVFVASISISALTFVTLILLWDALKRLHDSAPGDNTVNADIMFEFSALNLVIDIISCFLFISKVHANRDYPGLTSSKSYEKLNQSSKGEVLKIEVNEDIDVEIVNRRRNSITNIVKPSRNLNMASAFLHLGADTFRTLTVMVTAIIVEVESETIHSIDADAISSIVVCIIILAVVVALCFELIGLSVSLSSMDNQKTSRYTTVEMESE